MVFVHNAETLPALSLFAHAVAKACRLARHIHKAHAAAAKPLLQQEAQFVGDDVALDE